MQLPAVARLSLLALLVKDVSVARLFALFVRPDLAAWQEKRNISGTVAT